MTREESEKYIKSKMCNDCSVHLGGGKCSDNCKVIEAIKALEQEPCEDVVNRQPVKEQMIKYGFSAPDMTVTEFVEDLPPVNLQENWGDCISRQYLLDNCVVDKVTMPYVPVNRIENAPPVTPRSKTGH